MSTEYDGEPLDLRWKSYLGSDDGETVEATNNGETTGTMTSDFWPDAIPREPFENSQLQVDIVERLTNFGPMKNGECADLVGCSDTQVWFVRQKVSVFVTPDAVPFEIPEEPTLSDGVEQWITHEDSRISELESEPEIDCETVGTRYYDEGESTDSIADDLGVTVREVTGYLANYDNSTPIEDFEKLESELAEAATLAFNYLYKNPDATNAEAGEEIGYSHASSIRARHRSICYVDPSELPFETPDTPKETYLTKGDMEAFEKRTTQTEADSNVDSNDDAQTELTDHERGVFELREEIKDLENSRSHLEGQLSRADKQLRAKEEEIERLRNVVDRQADFISTLTFQQSATTNQTTTADDSDSGGLLNAVVSLFTA